MAVTAARKRAAQAAALQLFHALSDETRLGLLDMLRDGERCVCDLQDALDAAQSRLSFHLKVLKDAGLVTDRKEGRWSYYSIVPARLEEGRGFLEHLAEASPVVGGLTLHQLGRSATVASAPAPATSNGNPRVKRAARTTRGDCC